MITTSVPRSGCSRVTTAPAARIGRPDDSTASFRLPAVLTEGTVAAHAGQRRLVALIGTLHVQQGLLVRVGGMGQVPSGCRCGGRAVVEAMSNSASISPTCAGLVMETSTSATVEVAVHQVRGADTD